MCFLISCHQNNYTSTSHMSGALDWREKSKAQKLGHPMLVQPILSQKKEKSKFFNEQFLRNHNFSIRDFCL